MVLGLSQGYEAGDLVFLSAYLGQVRLMRRLLKTETSQDLREARVATIDNFQV